MDYIASEISLENEHLGKIAHELEVMNRQNNHSTISAQTNLQRIWDKRVMKNQRLLKNIDKIPLNTFKFEGMQTMDVERDKKCRRYELKTPFEAFAYFLILAYCNIKKNLRIDGYRPNQISIELNKGGVLENNVNIQLTKDNVDSSIILQFADIVDYLDLEINWFILWADPNTFSQKQKRRAISGKTRQNVLMRDNYTCQICGATVKDGVKLEIDHIKPVSKGGTNDENNLQVLCQQCNREKHNRTDLIHDKKKLAELGGK